MAWAYLSIELRVYQYLEAIAIRPTLIFFLPKLPLGTAAPSITFFMKKIALLMTGIICLVCSCKKSGTTSPPTTSLQITVTDNLGNTVQGALVALYSSESDFNNDVNRVNLQTTDSKGIVTFSNLQAIKYYWFAQNGCRNNIFGSVMTTNPITANIKNTVTTILQSTGVLKFVNTSTNPYHVYVNNQLYTDLAGGATKSTEFALAGSYTIRVVQISGYIVSPTDKTYTGTLSCGGTLTTTFP
jgi:hypothetical protein